MFAGDHSRAEYCPSALASMSSDPISSRTGLPLELHGDIVDSPYIQSVSYFSGGGLQIVGSGFGYSGAVTIAGNGIQQQLQYQGLLDLGTQNHLLRKRDAAARELHG